MNLCWQLMEICVRWGYEEGEKFLLLLNDESHTPVVVYTLVTWKGQEYVFEESKVLDKKAAGRIGKDPNAQYILSGYVDPFRDPKKDNSEFKKVAGANKRSCNQNCVKTEIYHLMML